MPAFRYLRDPLFLCGCAAYALNRVLLKPHLAAPFLHAHFNDLWLIPCALPVFLWLHRRLGWRTHDEPPRLSEIFLHLAIWSLLFEWLGPKFMPHTTADFGDVLAYVVGALGAFLWWHRPTLRKLRPAA